MRLDGVAAAIHDVASRFEIVVAKTDDELDEVFRLRYQVYCLERGFEPAVGGREIDRFDGNASHVLIRHQESRQAVGTARLVLPVGGDNGIEMPIDQICDAPLLRRLPRDRTAEISRFALSKRYRTEGGATGSLLRLMLTKAILALSGQIGLTHWCALMDPCLLRLLRASAIHFEPVGPLVEYHGFRQPAFASIGDMLRRGEREQPLIWDFVTEGGTLWHAPPLRVAA